jgi:hypothetical protein
MDGGERTPQLGGDEREEIDDLSRSAFVVPGVAYLDEQRDSVEGAEKVVDAPATAAPIVRRNASRASGEIRIAFATRTWCNSRRSQRPYTVAADRPSLAATCLIVRSDPSRIGQAIGVRTTGGPKSLGSVRNAWRESDRSSCPSWKDREGLSVAVTGCDVP